MNVRRYCLVFAAAVAVGAVFAQRTPPVPPGLPGTPPPAVRRLTIEQKYAEVGGESGRLGRPAAAETATPDGVGRYRLYRNGIIVWHPDLGAHALQGPIYYKYTSLSRPRPGEAGFLTTPLQSHGYPTTDETATTDGRRGVYNVFQRGIIFYVPGLIPDASGRQFAVEMHGPIYEKWKALFHGGFDLGYPTGNQLTIGDRRGNFQIFEHGAIYWSAATGAHEVHGAIRQRWIQSARSTGERDGGTRGPIGYPINEERDSAGGGRIQDFEHASIRSRVVPGSLSIVQYNTALLPHAAALIPIFGQERNEYRGKDRLAATNALIAQLRRQSPDIVGLSEVFISSDYIAEFRRLNPNSGYMVAENDRKRIKDGLASMYPHVAEIPVSGTGTFRMDLPNPATYVDLPRATELIFFSKWPITARNHAIYTHASGVDAKAAKGVLHIRVQPPGHPTGYDLFLTHLQNPGEGSTETERRRSRQAVQGQVHEMAAFISAHRSLERPALLLGDLNINGLDAAQHRELLRDLTARPLWDEPVDVWAQTRGDAPGITDDNGFSSFAPGSPGASPEDPRRGRRGGRIDWLLSWPGTRYWPNYQNTEVLVWQFGDGNDVSDHYGLKTRQADMREMTIIERITVRRSP